MDENLRLSDNDRINALQALASHYAEGRLDYQEFDERTAAASTARINADLRPLFEDLPGGIEEALTPTRTTSIANTQDSELEELATIKEKGKRVEMLDGAIFSVTLASFFILMFVFNVSHAWVVWPVMAGVMVIPRLLSGFSDADEEAYEELKEIEKKERELRLKQATDRLRELE